MSIKRILLKEISEEEKRRLFHEKVAQVQRGKPEQVMLQAQKIMGGGVMQVMVEHIGDLTHRMAERVTYDTAGFEYVEPKVKRGIGYLKSGYGFRREFEENIKNNASFYDKSPEQLMSDVKNVLRKYAQAHEQIEVYNELQEHARDAAIELGNMNYDTCLEHLQELKRHLDKGVDHWTEQAHKITMNL